MRTIATYRRLRFHVCIFEASSLAYDIQRQVNYVVSGVVICHIAISSQQVGSWDFSIVVENFVALLDRLDSFHNQGVFFLEQPGLRTVSGQPRGLQTHSHCCGEHPRSRDLPEEPCPSEVVPPHQSYTRFHHRPHRSHLRVFQYRRHTP